MSHHGNGRCDSAAVADILPRSLGFKPRTLNEGFLMDDERVIVAGALQVLPCSHANHHFSKASNSIIITIITRGCYSRLTWGRSAKAPNQVILSQWKYTEVPRTVVGTKPCIRLRHHRAGRRKTNQRHYRHRNWASELQSRDLHEPKF
jgi:hypothetical protein